MSTLTAPATLRQPSPAAPVTNGPASPLTSARCPQEVRQILDPPLHVCFLTHRFGPGETSGVANHIASLARELRPLDVTSSVICCSYGPAFRYTRDGFIDVIGVPPLRFVDRKLNPAMLGYGWRAGKGILGLHAERPIDLIHLHERVPVLGASRAAKALDIPLLYTAHSVWNGQSVFGGSPGVDLCRLVERRIARSGTPIIAVSPSIRDELVRIGAARHAVDTVHNGVDVARFPFSGPEGRDPDEILFVGRFEPEKGFDVLLRAIALLAPRRPVHLVANALWGDEEGARRLAGELGIASRVRFAGRVVGADLLTAYHHTSVCVLPARADPAPLVMFEAMATGAPFVGSRVGGIADVARDGETALLVPPENPEALAAAITRLLDNPALAARLAANARRTIEQNFTWAQTALYTRGLYDALLAQRRANDLSNTPDSPFA